MWRVQMPAGGNLTSWLRIRLPVLKTGFVQGCMRMIKSPNMYHFNSRGMGRREIGHRQCILLSGKITSEVIPRMKLTLKYTEVVVDGKIHTSTKKEKLSKKQSERLLNTNQLHVN